MKVEYCLGIDIGTSSLGLVAYALKDGQPIPEILHCESYIFGESTAKDSNGIQTKNSIRREARLIRRQHQRKASRYKKLFYLLNILGLSYDEIKKVRSASSFNIFKLRAEALHKKISLEEFTCVLSHLIKNRGYAGSFNNEEKSQVGNYIALFNDKLQEYNVQTLGELWYKKQSEQISSKERMPWKNISEKGTFLKRETLEDEFDKLWDSQSQYHSILNQNIIVPNDTYFPPYKQGEDIPLKKIFFSALFYQRPIQWDTDTIGTCPYEKGKKRASIGQPSFQQYRIIKAIHNLRLKNVNSLTKKGYKGEPLSKEVQKTILNLVNTRFDLYTSEARIPFATIYDELQISPNTYIFNVDNKKDNEEDRGLLGNVTLYSLYSLGLLDLFNSFSVETQEAIIELLSCVTDKAELIHIKEQTILKQVIERTLQSKNEELTTELLNFIKQSIQIASTLPDIPSGRASFSIEALKKITASLTESLLELKENTARTDDTEYDIIQKLYPEDRATTLGKPLL